MCGQFIIKAETPCHHRSVRLVATEGVPRESYDRKCKCGAEWRITRETLRVRKGIRTDRLTWQLEG